MGRSKRRRRDTRAIANRRLHSFSSSPSTPGRRDFVLGEFEDRRRWHPEGPQRSPVRTDSRRARLVVGPSRVSQRPSGRFANAASLWSSLPSAVAFAQPEKVLVCVRRHRRREVLFARGKTGRGRRRRPRFNFYSRVSCRR